jgi:hypothetical protein
VDYLLFPILHKTREQAERQNATGDKRDRYTALGNWVSDGGGKEAIYGVEHGI